jgi:hypothetical protein
MGRVGREKVLEKVAHYWPDVDPQVIMRILDEYGLVSSERGRARVQLAILKLSEGQRERLPELVRMAKLDYRDVLAYAEYPEEMRTGFVGMRQLSVEEQAAIRRRDREQYEQWLDDSGGRVGGEGRRDAGSEPGHQARPTRDPHAL